MLTILYLFFLSIPCTFVSFFCIDYFSVVNIGLVIIKVIGLVIIKVTDS